MPAPCAVSKCRNKNTVHRFPTDATRIKKWLTAMKRENFRPNKYSRICKDHFKPGDYVLPKDSVRNEPLPRLKKDAVPSIFEWTKESSLPVSAAQVPPEVSSQHQDHNEGCSVCVQSFCVCEAHMQKLSFSKSCSCKQINGTVCPESVLRLHTLRNNPKRFYFYTGLRNYDYFVHILRLLGDSMNCLYYYPHFKPIQHHRLLQPPDELLLTLVMLCRYMSFDELEHSFGIGKADIAQIFITWINYLYCIFKDADILKSINAFDRKKCVFHGGNPCFVLMQCVEVKLIQPLNPFVQQLTYSIVKKCHTTKVLMGISCCGGFQFVSDGYGGSISNHEIFQNEFHKATGCFGDKHVLVFDGVFRSHNVPSQMQNQFSAMCACHPVPYLRKCYKISNNILGYLLQTYTMLQGEVFTSDLAFASRIVFVCCKLVNFGGFGISKSDFWGRDEAYLSGNLNSREGDSILG